MEPLQPSNNTPSADLLKPAAKPAENPLAQDPKDLSRARLVKELTEWCVEEREFWKPIFDKMREEMKFAAGLQWQRGYENRTGVKEAYQGDVVQQMINRQTASLYAKNPEPEAELEERLVFELWDGDQSSIDAAKAIMAQAQPILAQASQISQTRQQMLQQHAQSIAAGGPGINPSQIPPEPPAPPPQVTRARDILRDYENGMAEKAMLAKVARTGTLLLKQQWRSQSPDMLVSGKQATSQVLVSRVAYVKVMYRRDMESAATTSANDMEFSDRIATLQAQLQTLEQDATQEDDPKHAEAKLLKASLQQQIAEMQAQQPPPVAGDEGIVHDWLGSTSVIVDRRCTCLREFVGARRIAQEMFMDAQDAEAKFKINLKDSGARFYLPANGEYKRGEENSYGTGTGFEGKDNQVDFKRLKVCVFEIQDKTTGLLYTVIDGVRDFIKEPAANTPEVSRFWSIVPIVFNCQVIEENLPADDVTIFPRSNIRLAMPMQIDINTAGEGLREHRVANRPCWTGVKSKFASTGAVNDLEKLARPRAAHELIMLENLQPGEKIEDFIQPLPTKQIDPKMYDNAASSQAMMLATGEQPSDLGAQRPDEKATGQNIAAQARATSIGSNIDDLDFAYSTIAQMDWEMLIQEMPVAVVKELVGRGATWPDLSREDAARSISFKISAGSTGRPNEQADLNNFKIIAPQLGQLMTDAGKSLEPLIKEGVRRLGDRLDVDEFLKPAQILPPPAPQPEPQKPPSIAITIPFQFAPPEIQSQIEQMAGMKPASPQSHLLEKVGHGEAVKAAHENTTLASGGKTPLTNSQN